MACRRCGAPTQRRLCRECEFEEYYGVPEDYLEEEEEAGDE